MNDLRKAARPVRRVRSTAAAGPARPGMAAGREAEHGAALVMVLVLGALLALLAMSLLFITDIDYRMSANYTERTRALDYTDSGIHELLWRLNLTPGAAAPPAGSTITVNNLVSYDASINPDPMGILTNEIDDDGDGGLPDESDELNYWRDWQVRLVLSPNVPAFAAPYEVADTNITAGPPWGNHTVISTVQPQATWREYSANDPSDASVLYARFKLDTDTAEGDSEGDGAEIVFYDHWLTRNGVDDPNTFNTLGGDGNHENDSPYNINWSDGAITRKATGQPVILVRVTGTARRGGQVAGRRTIEAEVFQERRSVITKALCGCGDLDLSGGGATDSYKSSEGAYGSGPVYSNGDIGCNAEIKLGGGYVANGNGEAGTNIIFSGSSAAIERDATGGGYIEDDKFNVFGLVTEYQVPPPQPCDCDHYDVVAMVAAAKLANDNASILPNGTNPYDYPTNVIDGGSIYQGVPGDYNLKLSGDDGIILTGGDYYFGSIDSSGVIQVGVDGDGDGLVDGPPTQKVRIFVENDIGFSGHGLINDSRPTDVEIYCSANDGDIGISGGSEFRGLIYAPLTDIDLTGGMGFSGAALGKDVKNTGGGQVHFDEDLMDAHVEILGYRVLSWHEE